MRQLGAGTSGSVEGFKGAVPEGSLDSSSGTIVARLLEGRPLRPVQHAALVTHGILSSRRHLLVSAPTNSGKSLIGHLLLLEAVMKGRRAVLVEPLRALAREQADQLTEDFGHLVPEVMARPPRIRVSTGDYRLEDERPSDAPPAEGEVVVATPERLDAILRNPAHLGWASSIGSVVIDEAHLLGDARRGPTIELVVASMLSMPAPPRLALLSATVGEPERLAAWLDPCTLVTSSERTPLDKAVWSLGEDEDPDTVLEQAIRDVLAADSSAALVFVYRRRSAEGLASTLSESLGAEVHSYHSGQSASERARIRARYKSGQCRCLVATTALAMGVNLPATHVFVRDTTFFGHGRLRIDELLQILGRAGRGDRKGIGIVLLRPSDDWEPEELATALREETLPPLRSSFEAQPRAPRKRHGSPDDDEGAPAELVATCMARSGDAGVTSGEIASLLGHTLGGPSLLSRIDPALRWLTDPARALAYSGDDSRYRLTVLGRAGVQSMLPLGYVAGVGQLVRDLISLDPSTRLLGRWSGLDHLFLISLASDRAPRLRRFSESLAEQVDGWLEKRPVGEKSLLFADWVAGDEASSKADELFGSLSLSERRGGSQRAPDARKRSYVAMLSAILLEERSEGRPCGELEKRWGIQGLEGAEESWRDSALWMLSGHAAICQIRAFYHHLQANCGSTPEQCLDAKKVLGRMRSDAYDAIERLKYCSPLGPLMRGVRQSLGGTEQPTIGVGTIRTLEAAGVTSIQQVAQLEADELVRLGVQKRFARQLREYVRRRMR